MPEKSVKNIKKKYSPLLKNYDVPRGKIKLEIIEKLLLERLFVLFFVEKINTPNLNIEEKREKLLDILIYHNLKLYVNLLSKKAHAEHQFHENVAHIFLNGVFSPWKESANWIKEQELTLFTWQTSSFSSSESISFLAENETKLPEATTKQKEMIREKLESYREDGDIRELSETVIYEIPWTLAGDLGGSRQIAHHLGLAYVPEEKIKRIFPAIYEKHLNNERKNNIYKTAVKFGLQKVHLKQIRGFLFYIYSRKLRDFRKLKISMSTIDNYKNCFPPCARIIHEELDNRLHLKFNTRRQYWLFLKGIGAEATDVSLYMRHYFVELGRMKEQDYREHHYFILLLFGLVGSRADYQVPNCSANREDPRGCGEVNGCPFAEPGQVDIEDLDKILTKWNVPETDKEEILGYRKTQDCSKACSAYFKSIHEKPLNREIVNPLDFFGASLEYIQKRMRMIPDDIDEQLNEEFPDEKLKAPLPRYPEVFSEDLKARIQKTLTVLAQKKKKEQAQRGGEVGVKGVEKKAEVPKPKPIIVEPVKPKIPMIPKASSSFAPVRKRVIVPVVKRVSLMPKASSSVPKRPVLKSSFVPASHLVKLNLSQPVQSSQTQQESAEIKEVLIKKEPQLPGNGEPSINPSKGPPPLAQQPEIPPERKILIEQTRSEIEPELCPAGEVLLERACCSLKPEVSVTTEELMLRTLAHMSDDDFKKTSTDLEPPPIEEPEEIPEKDRTRGWAKRMKWVYIPRHEDEPEPELEYLEDSAIPVMDKNLAKMSDPVSSEPYEPTGQMRKKRRTKKWLYTYPFSD